ncbi:hypothetical protein EYF80_027840 [Liparis tanakae]|uniref:Uncharacterized protein n=1 Tax=Liparis tanakae TaxID=230148 RepID=A0A4Z2HA75_9TELE|nr:hypothetical protein EYF80_027840 [Liparis tanakae]
MDKFPDCCRCVALLKVAMLNLFLRVGVWLNGLWTFKRGFMGNVLGEGFVLEWEWVREARYQAPVLLLLLLRGGSRLQREDEADGDLKILSAESKRRLVVPLLKLPSEANRNRIIPF